MGMTSSPFSEELLGWVHLPVLTLWQVKWTPSLGQDSDHAKIGCPTDIEVGCQLGLFVGYLVVGL